MALEPVGIQEKVLRWILQSLRGLLSVTSYVSQFRTLGRPPGSNPIPRKPSSFRSPFLGSYYKRPLHIPLKAAFDGCMHDSGPGNQQHTFHGEVKRGGKMIFGLGSSSVFVLLALNQAESSDCV